MMIVGRIGMLVVSVSSSPECGDFDDLPAKANVRQPETPANQAAIAEQGLDFLGMGVGRDVEVLGMQLEQCIAHPATYQKRLKPRFVQPVQDFERAFGNFCPRNIVGRAGNDLGFSGFFSPAAIQ